MHYLTAILAEVWESWAEYAKHQGPFAVVSMIQFWIMWRIGGAFIIESRAERLINKNLLAELYRERMEKEPNEHKRARISQMADEILSERDLKRGRAMLKFNLGGMKEDA